MLLSESEYAVIKDLNGAIHYYLFIFKVMDFFNLYTGECVNQVANAATDANENMETFAENVVNAAKSVADDTVNSNGIVDITNTVQSLEKSYEEVGVDEVEEGDNYLPDGDEVDDPNIVYCDDEDEQDPNVPCVAGG